MSTATATPNTYSDEALKNDLVELMNAWTMIEREAKEWFPKASKEEIYKITKGAMDHALGFDKR